MPKRCPYCEADNNDFIPLNQTVNYSGIEMSLNRQGVLRIRFGYADCSYFESQDIVNIQYCPMCGRKFG